MSSRPALRLTAAHVARVHRDIADAGPPPGIQQMQDEDYAALVAELMAEKLPGPLYVFAYGSLLWKPAVEFGTGVPADVPGWHRSFCLKLVRYRGTAEQPGLMMALDRGGSCRGLVFPVNDVEPEVELHTLLRRETSNKPPTNQPRWLTALTPDGPVRAIGFTVDRKGWAYQTGLSPRETARILARACGHWGSGAEYLFNTVDHLTRLGIRDRNLLALQELVAEEIEREHGPCG